MAEITPPAEPPTLSTLPNEILSSIFGYCNVEYTQCENMGRNTPHALYNLCLCSKYIKAIAEPVLYSVVRQRYSGGHQDIQILRSLLRRPELAENVKRLELVVVSRDPDLSLEEVFHVYELAGLRHAIHSFNGQSLESSEWMVDVLHGHGDATAAILLTLLPRLQSLSLLVSNGRRENQFHYHWIPKVVQEAISKQGTSRSVSSLGQLQALGMRLKSIYDTNVPLSKMSQLLSLSSLRRIKLEKEQFELDELLFTSSIRDVELRIDGVHRLAHIIRCFPALERFSLEVSQYTGDGVPTILRILQPARLTLRHLYLDGVRYNWNYNSPYDQTLIDFERLESIDMPTMGLWIEESIQRDNNDQVDWNNGLLESKFAEFFPPSLRQLTLRHASITTLQHAFNLLKSKNKSFPHFKHLHVVVFDSAMHPYWDTWKELQALGAECGVEVVVSLR